MSSHGDGIGLTAQLTLAAAYNGGSLYVPCTSHTGGVSTSPILCRKLDFMEDRLRILSGMIERSAGRPSSPTIHRDRLPARPVPAQIMTNSTLHLVLV
jgi:hypothetical protein